MHHVIAPFSFFTAGYFWLLGIDLSWARLPLLVRGMFFCLTPEASPMKPWWDLATSRLPKGLCWLLFHFKREVSQVKYCPDLGLCCLMIWDVDVLQYLQVCCFIKWNCCFMKWIFWLEWGIAKELATSFVMHMYIYRFIYLDYFRLSYNSKMPCINISLTSDRHMVTWWGRWWYHERCVISAHASRQAHRCWHFQGEVDAVWLSETGTVPDDEAWWKKGCLL